MIFRPYLLDANHLSFMLYGISLPYIGNSGPTDYSQHEIFEGRPVGPP